MCVSVHGDGVVCRSILEEAMARTVIRPAGDEPVATHHDAEGTQPSRLPTLTTHRSQTMALDSEAGS